MGLFCYGLVRSGVGDLENDRFASRFQRPEEHRCVRWAEWPQRVGDVGDHDVLIRQPQPGHDGIGAGEDPGFRSGSTKEGEG